MTNYIEKLAQYISLRKDFDDNSEKYRDALSKEFIKFFKENKEVDKVRMVGYTPYFNDGSPCIWHLSEMSFEDKDNTIIFGENYAFEDEDEEIEADRVDYSSAKFKTLQVNCEVVKNFIETMGESFKDIFGDHVEVIIKRDSNEFYIEEYDHD